MNLTKDQLTQIQVFIKQKGFTYIDVQMEILDHVASAVEEKMTKDANLTFANAINQTHKSFGIYGFSSIEDGITRGLDQKYLRLFYKNIVSFFKPKYIAITTLVFLILYKIQYFIQQKELLFPLFLVAMVALVVILYVQYFRSQSFKNYLAFRTSAAYLSMLGAFLSTGSVISNALKTPHFYDEINLNFLMVSAMVGLFYIYVFAAIKTAKSGIADSSLLMEKYNLVK